MAQHNHADDEQTTTDAVLSLDALEPGTVLELTYDGSRGSRTVRGYVAAVETSTPLLDKYAQDYEVRIGTPDDHTPRFLRLAFETTPEDEDEGTYSFSENFEYVRSMNSKSDRGQRLGRIEGVTVTDETDDRGVQVAQLRDVVEGDVVSVGDREATVLSTSGHGTRVEFENGDRNSLFYGATRGVYYSVIDDDYDKTVYDGEFRNTDAVNTATDEEKRVYDRTADRSKNTDRGRVEKLVIDGDIYEVEYRPTDRRNTVDLRSPEFDEDEVRWNYDATLALEPTGLRLSPVHGGDVEPRTLDAADVELVHADDAQDEDDDEDEDDRELATDGGQETNGVLDLSTGDSVRVDYETTHGNAASFEGKVQHVTRLNHGYADAVVWFPDEDRRYRLAGVGDSLNVDSLRSGTSRTVGYNGTVTVVETDAQDDENDVATDGGQVLDLPDYGNVADYADDVDLSEFSDDDLDDLDDRLSDMLNGDPYAFPSDEALQAASDLSARLRDEQANRDPRRDDPYFTPRDSDDRYEVEITSVEVEQAGPTTFVRLRLDDDYEGDGTDTSTWTTRPGLDHARLVRDYLDLDDLRAIGTCVGQSLPVVGSVDGGTWLRLDRYALENDGTTALDDDTDPDDEDDDDPELVTDGGQVTDEDSDAYSLSDARTVIQEAYGGARSEDEVEVADLSGVHNGATSFLALFDQHTNDAGDPPDDLDSDTKRRLQTAQTVLSRALIGLEQTAADRLNENDTDDLDDEQDST